MTLSSATPLPMPLAIVTVPCLAAFTRPGQPSRLSGRNCSGSSQSSSTRRKMPATGRLGDLLVAEQGGEQPGHPQPVLEHVADPGRDPHVVLEDPELALLVADQV